MLTMGWHHSHSHHHHINATHPPLLSLPPPHQCVRHHHHYCDHPTLMCQCNFTPIQPTSATTFFLNHNTHHHHQQVLMTRWWVYLVSPPSCSPLPSPSTMTLTMATNKSQWLVGVFFWSLHHPLHSPLPLMSFNLVVNDKCQHNQAMRSSKRMSEKWGLKTHCVLSPRYVFIFHFIYSINNYLCIWMSTPPPMPIIRKNPTCWSATIS